VIVYKGRQIPETFEEIVDPKHTAIIVHEMLNDFCKKDGAFKHADPQRTLVQDLPGLLGPTVNLVDKARKVGVKVIYVGWTNYPDNSSRSDPEIQSAYKSIMDGTYIMQKCLFEGTWGHQVIDELKPQEGDLFLNKYKRDAFAGTSLESILQWNGIRTFIIVGIGVHIGIVPTVSNGVNKGYFVVVPEDCMLAAPSEWLDAAMKFLGMWAIVKPSSDLIKAWKSS